MRSGERSDLTVDARLDRCRSRGDASAHYLIRNSGTSVDLEGGTLYIVEDARRLPGPYVVEDGGTVHAGS